MKIIKNDLKTYILSLNGNKYIILYSLSFICIAFIISLSSPEHYDTGLYHFQSIKWIEEYSVVPGLANLHGRFGFNPNIFTFFALTSIYDLFNQEIFSLNFTVFAILVLYFINKLYSLFKHQGFSNLFVFYFILFLIVLKLPFLSSPTPDFLSTAIPLFIFARILDLSYNKVNNGFKSYFPILVLTIYMLTVKLSTLPTLILFIFVIIKYKSEFRKSLWLLPILSLIIMPWLARNIIMTGWLIYPFPSLDLFSFDWKVPIENVAREKEAVTGWARSPDVNFINVANMPLIDWFPIWWDKVSFPHSLLFLLSLVFPLIALVCQLIKKIKIDLFTNAVIFTSFFGVIFWFFLAPDWRFGECFVLIASMSPLLFLKSFLTLNINLKYIFSVLLIFLLGYYTMFKGLIFLTAISPLLLFKFFLSPKYRTQVVFGLILFAFLGNYIWINQSKINVNSYKFLHSNYIITPPRIEIPHNVNFKTYNINGINIYVPTEGDRCFDHNIPCTTYIDKSFILRKNKLKSGFKPLVNNNR